MQSAHYDSSPLVKDGSLNYLLYDADRPIPLEIANNTIA